jgi:hypothetical protein
MLDGNIFDEEVFYERNPDSKWGKFKCLFAISHKTGMPHSDRSYECAFKAVLQGLQELLDQCDIDYVVIRLKDEGKGFFGRTETDITPHSTRITVASEYCTVLPYEYVGRYITGQTPGVVAYYDKDDAERIINPLN